MEKVKYFKGNWTTDDVLLMKDCLFVYGDNDLKTGKGGQSIIRDLPNTVGIPTKKAPNNLAQSFYNDNELGLNMEKISIAINNVIEKSKHYKIVYLSEGGLGTERAKLPILAPKTFEYLNKAVSNMIGKINDDAVII